MARQPKLATAILPAELSQEIATTGSGRDITRTWTTMLQQPKDRRILGAVDWGAYDEIRKDDQVKSCMQQRILAVISAEWDVVAGDDEDPRSVAAADALKTNLAAIGIDAVTEKMAWLTFYGYQVAEIIWGEPDDGLIPIAQIKVRHARRFRYDKDGLLRLVTRAAPLGELLPDRKFWVAVAGATNDDEPYGEGLADWLYWPTFFKRNGIRFWNIFLDKFGTPTAKATYRRGTPAADIAKIVQALRAMATDSGIVVPEGTAIELLQAARSGTGDFEKLCRYMDEAIAKIILSQTMTTQDGASLSQAQVHAGVKLEVVKADGDLICESFNAGPARWWSNLNYGPEVAAPRLVRLVEEEADLKMMAETDTVLESQGWVRTEESFTDTYGNGYERKPPSIAGAEAHLRGLSEALSGQLEAMASHNVSIAQAVLQQVVDETAFNVFLEQPGNNFPVMVLGESTRDLIGAKSAVVRLSSETFAKQLIKHPELSLNDYRKLVELGASPQIIMRQGDLRIVLLKTDAGKWIKATVKVTRDGSELYMVSFQLATAREIARLRLRNEVVRDVS